ncbi:MAG TPA: hypothetical protein VHT94_07320 [Streptosporangiaceae bacterium]|jgi:hypothetical protein|nr:hypothetical protein [Streptosporangiaceae bacterium]
MNLMGDYRIGVDPGRSNSLAFLVPVPGGTQVVYEITDGRHYDVAALAHAGKPGEVIGEDIPAWVARVIVACLEGPVRVTVHFP